MSDYDAAALVRTAILRMEPRFSRGKLAEMAGVTPTAISDFLNKKPDYPQIGMDKVTNLCRAVKIPVAKFLAVTSADTRPASDDTSNRTPGDVPNAVEAGLLRARALELEEENAALRIALRAGSDKLKELATDLAKSARPARGGVRRPSQRKPVAG